VHGFSFPFLKIMSVMVMAIKFLNLSVIALRLLTANN